jgi:hypothetical protein
VRDQVSRPYKNNRQNYGFVYFSIYVVREETLNWMVASIPQI